MTTPNTPTSQGLDNQEPPIPSNFWPLLFQMHPEFKPKRKRYSRKKWRLKKEIESKSRDVLIKFIEGPDELR